MLTALRGFAANSLPDRARQPRGIEIIEWVLLAAGALLVIGGIIWFLAGSDGESGLIGDIFVELTDFFGDTGQSRPGG